MYAVMDVCSPHASCKQQQLKGQEVHRDEEEEPTVRNSLQAPRRMDAAVVYQQLCQMQENDGHQLLEAVHSYKQVMGVLSCCGG